MKEFGAAETVGNWGKNPGKDKATKGKSQNLCRCPLKSMQEALTVHTRMQESIESGEENNI